jgi:deoxyribonuclease IV
MKLIVLIKKMLGATVPTVGGIEKAFFWGDKWDCDVVQFYLTLSRKWQVDEINKDKVDIFKNSWKKSSVKEVVAHIPYLVNLVSENKLTKEKSIHRMILEIERAKILGVKYLVLHPGSVGQQDKKSSLKTLKNSFDEIFNKVEVKNIKILIETMAGQGSSLGSSFKEIAEIIYILNNDNVFNVCFDTAHVLESGYDIRDRDGYKKTLIDFEKNIPINKIMAFHLNDSKTILNSKKDRHEHIGEGEIGLSFFKELLNDDRFKNIPKIIETPSTEEKNEDNLKLLRSLIN